MRVLLDECLPRKLAEHLKGHEVRSVPGMGWTGKTNGELLRLVAGRFDVFLTVDSNLLRQQNLSRIPVGIIALVSKSNRLADLLSLMPEVHSRLSRVRPGQIIRIGV